MGRSQRINLPGYAFHITTRTQGHLHWFTEPLRTSIVPIVKKGIASSGSRLISFAIMTNHLHIVVVQGSNSLGWMMQPILRRIALLVQRTTGCAGHVFERRYRAHVLDARHAMNAVLYVHRNPLTAGLIGEADNYEWSSHSAYLGRASTEHLCIEEGLQMFGSSGEESLEELRAVYLAKFNRLHYDAAAQSIAGDDRCFAMLPRLSGSVADVPHVLPSSRSLIDLRDAAEQLIKSLLPGCNMEILRSRYGGPLIVDARRQLIAALIQRGYRGVDIARYLRIAPSRVSAVRSSMRWAGYECE